ncbi:hypothetical protein [Henriciella aquimarina]|uniref:hypothetical protein n=1 Tax=Henriciella aquimarina TaxID=545261 RepID=UPI000A01694A|nr:hypothetical protein [Henriciella aquimarina]
MSALGTLYHRLEDEALHYWGEILHWLSRRSDAEQLVIACVFILLLLGLIIRMSMRGKDPGSTGRQFGGSIVLVMIFAFGIGWMIDAGAGRFSFLFS